MFDHVLPILWGKGANGKSVLVETMLHVFGPDYGCKAVSDLLLAKRNETHPTERADLHGKRLVACTETDENRRLAEALVKELTGGDTIKARRMREDFWSFRPSHTAVLVTNHKPEVRGTDMELGDGCGWCRSASPFRRRIRIIDWPRSYTVKRAASCGGASRGVWHGNVRGWASRTK